MLDLLYRYYPKYHANELFILAEDILKWVNKELPTDSSSHAYLIALFGSPRKALSYLRQELKFYQRFFSQLN